MALICYTITNKSINDGSDRYKKPIKPEISMFVYEHIRFLIIMFIDCTIGISYLNHKR